MVRIRKDKGGTSIGSYHWPEDGSVCEVPDELAADLLADPEWGYTREPDPEPEEPGCEDGDDGEGPAGEGEGEQPPDPGEEGDGEENAEDQGEEKKPPAKPAARRSRAKGAPA